MCGFQVSNYNTHLAWSLCFSLIRPFSCPFLKLSGFCSLYCVIEFVNINVTGQYLY